MEKYLSRYAEPEISALADLAPPECWTNVVVIPVCNESSDFLRTPPPSPERSLMILVINGSPSASHEVSAANLSLANSVKERFELLWKSAPEAGIGLYRDPQAQRDILMVDRFSEGRQIPVKGGVGHARKIGADLAACLIHHNQIKSCWIHCTDADVCLPETYFSSSACGAISSSGCSTLVYPFHHQYLEDDNDNSGIELATLLYELSLRYYVAGMRYAQSPYACHTIGSTMAVNADHYAKVRGFQKREAGEDFYLINKLAKVGTVTELQPGPECSPIVIAARKSDRVPFGTGAAVNKITAFVDPVIDFRFYHPLVFECLQHWLQSLPTAWESRSCEIGEIITLHGQHLIPALEELNTRQALEHAFRQSRDLEQFKRQMHTWFDAFRTLKLIHHLRDGGLSSVSYSALINAKTFIQLLALDDELRTFHQRLEQLLVSQSAGFSLPENLQSQ
jgi:hypothetical protein